jgi:4-aminobutyrate aminotransferase-like enzyme
MSNHRGNEDLLQRRSRLLGASARLFYEQPVHLVSGAGVWVTDSTGKRYLDCYNNVPHVGHCHPHVVAALSRQAATLNTHTRYLHDGILDYVERLTAKMSDSITSAIMVCTGSEANDIALRMAEVVTGHKGIIATNHTYHGNTSAVSQLSTTRPPVGGYGGHVRHIMAPDSYRPVGGTPESHATAFADAVLHACQSLQQSGHGVAALIICASFVNEGFPDLAPDFLKAAINHVREAGGIIIADEVQPGFGRIGSHFWGYEKAGITPDIVTLGKPMGNGHPVAAVATSLEHLNAFHKAFNYFNTFGGNPVSCAVASAVLDVIEQEKLQENAQDVGLYIRQGLQRLADKHALIGDVRGSGLAIGAELVLDRHLKTPATRETARLVELMRENGVLLGSNGLSYNVLKMRPPLPFSKANADVLLAALDHSFGAL